jgi:3-methyladenine DNA glycosylase AlkD
VGLNEVRADVRKCASRKNAAIAQRFFKTGPGEYAEGDVFLGLRAAQMRGVAKTHRDLNSKDLKKLLHSKYHEDRAVALLIMTEQFARGDVTDREKLYEMYIGNTKYVNNWDLVDLSAGRIVGAYLADKGKQPLTKLAKSPSLWERRIAIIATSWFIQLNEFDETLRIARMLLHDDHDLIHKAVGWMLREVGKRDVAVEEGFLKRHYRNMPRTMLRYAIERFPEGKRQKYLKGRI